ILWGSGDGFPVWEAVFWGFGGVGIECAEEPISAGAEEEIADMGGVGLGFAISFGQGDRAGSDRRFADVGLAGDFLDFVAVSVAGEEIHSRINSGGITGKEEVDFADVFAEAFPVGAAGEFEMAMDAAEKDGEQGDVVAFVSGDGGKKLTA